MNKTQLFRAGSDLDHPVPTDRGGGVGLLGPPFMLNNVNILKKKKGISYFICFNCCSL